MPQYLADLLAGFPGFRGTVRSRNMLGDEEVPMPGRAEVTSLGGTGSVGPRDLLSSSSRMRTRAGLGDIYDDAGAGEGWSAYSGQPMPPPRPRMAAPGGPMPPLNGQPQQVTPHPMAPDVPMAGGPGVRPPMGRPQAGGGGQPQPLLPSGHTPPQRFDGLGRSGGTDLLGRAKGWLNAEAFPANQPMSRGMVLAQMLGQFGAGLSQTGRVGPGLQAANQTMMGLRQHEQERGDSAYKRELARLELELKRQELAQGGKVTPFGGQDTGFYVMGPDGQPRQVVPPRDSSANVAEATTPFQAQLRALKPEERTPERIQQLAEQEQARKDALSPAEQAREARAEAAARRAEESLALSRQAGERAERTASRAAEQPTAATLTERNRALIGRVDEIVEGQGWEAVPATDRRAYERVYREMAVPRRIVDPLTGTVTETQPDVTDLPVPPGYGGAAAGAPPPAPGVTQPERVLGREQVEAATKAMSLRERSTGALDRLEELLDEAGASGRLAGDARGRIEQAASPVVTLLGALGEAGVLQPSDIDRFSRELGNLTGLGAAGMEASGLDTSRARIDELRQRIDRETKAKLPKVRSQAEAEKMPPGVPFLLPDGSIGMR